MEDSCRETCSKLQVLGQSVPAETYYVYVKGTWFSSCFTIAISDCISAWICNASKSEVQNRAALWDQSVEDYIRMAEIYLGSPQPGSSYSFIDAGDGEKRLSWTFEKEGTKLEWRWKCKLSDNSQKAIAEVFDFLMGEKKMLNEKVAEKTESFENMKRENDKCLALCEKSIKDRSDFESVTYAKFVKVLNAKKRKLRELRDKLGSQN